MISSLPIEICQLIIKLSLGPFKLSTNRSRYDSLLKYMLVSHLWKVLAEEELYKHIVIQSEETLEFISDKFKTDISLGGRTEALAIDLVESASIVLENVNIIIILSACVKVREVWLIGFPSNQILELPWSNLRYLSSLYFVECRANPYTKKALDILPQHDIFPCLTKLTLMNCWFSDDQYPISDFLSHSLLPRLTSLTCIHIDEFSTPITIDPILFNKLENLTLFDRQGESEDALIESMVSMSMLRTLIIRDIFNLMKQSNNLSASTILSLENLVIPNFWRSYCDDIDTLSKWLDEKLPLGHKMDTITFPASGFDKEDTLDLDVVEELDVRKVAVDNLRISVSDKGIKLKTAKILSDISVDSIEFVEALRDLGKFTPVAKQL